MRRRLLRKFQHRRDGRRRRLRERLRHRRWQGRRGREAASLLDLGKGTLTIGTDASYAPSEFVDTDGKTVVGFDADLAKALGQVLGLNVTLQNAPFGTIIEGVKSGKFDLGVSSFTINPDRMKQVDMVSYYSAGTSWAVPSGNPMGITPDNACGKKIAVQKDTVQVDDITARPRSARTPASRRSRSSSTPCRATRRAPS